MAQFRIQPHGRLHEWVAEEQGYFRDEGLDYEFVTDPTMVSRGGYASVQAADGAAPRVQAGAFEEMEQGRACEISSACHWAVNMVASTQRGRMWGHAYSVAPAAIVVPPESPIQKPADLVQVPIGVGYHSGSHFSALQALHKVFPPDEIELSFIGGTQDRLFAMLDRKVPAANVFSVDLYLLLQQGFRAIVDTTFMIGHLVSNEAGLEDVERFFRALRRAQKDIDLAPERYKQYLLKAIPEKLHPIVDVTGFGPGERIVFEDYTQEMYEQTHRWLEDLQLFPEGQVGHAGYEVAVAL
jgi:ABC-type nitrate/sulfonate/bicarbonate transport system substrate-binding protein